MTMRRLGFPKRLPVAGTTGVRPFGAHVVPA